MSLKRILKAESVAIVGASKNETKRGYQTIRTLLDEKYEGKIYPVNPQEKSILGIKCYESVSAIDEPVDVVLVATPARTLPAVLEDCGQKGVKARLFWREDSGNGAGRQKTGKRNGGGGPKAQHSFDRSQYLRHD